MVVALFAGCTPALTSTMSAGSFPDAPGEQAKCKVAASQSSPLVTEWPASEKANLEAMLTTGGVAVAYSGCSMRVLSQCRLGGGYLWQRTTPATDVLSIGNEDELYAKLPLGAVALEGELKRSGTLAVSTTVSGQLKLGGITAADVPMEGECAAATHIVGGLSVGAFSLEAGAEASGQVSASVVQVGEGGAGAKRTKSLIRSAGDVNSCGLATNESPHADCISPIQVFLFPLPGRASEEGPPGTVKVDFVAANANGRWDVYYDDEVICSTPCSRWVDPARPVMLRARDESYGLPDRIELLNLGNAAGNMQLQAHPTAQGKRATGIVFTALGGMTVITGITLTSLGASSDTRSGLMTGGLISLGVGIPVTLGAIWMIVTAGAHAEAHQSYAVAPAPLNSGTRIVWGPGSISGTF
jgi:cytoskeletal protein CcmA (bactofilin family)